MQEPRKAGRSCPDGAAPGFGREMMLASVAQGLGFQCSQGQEAKPWAHRKRVMELYGISTLPVNGSDLWSLP